mgnify:CR=1 FL=1
MKLGTPLSPAALSKVLDLMILKEIRTAKERGIGLEITPAARAWMLAQNEHPEWGARPLRRILQRSVRDRDWDWIIDVNLKGVFFATQAFVRQCQATGRSGKIINISSVHEELAFPNFAAYCASKGGVRMLTRTLAVELGPLGITINSIAPGAIETPINAALLNDPAKLQSLLRQIPLGRLGVPKDVAGLAVFLASSDSDYVTGTTYLVDGGLTVFYKEQ